MSTGGGVISLETLLERLGEKWFLMNVAPNTAARIMIAMFEDSSILLTILFTMAHLQEHSRCGQSRKHLRSERSTELVSAVYIPVVKISQEPFR